MDKIDGKLLEEVKPAFAKHIRSMLEDAATKMTESFKMVMRAESYAGAVSLDKEFVKMIADKKTGVFRELFSTGMAVNIEKDEVSAPITKRKFRKRSKKTGAPIQAKKVVENSATETVSPAPSAPKKQRGRPKGSFKKQIKGASTRTSPAAADPLKKRGRPKGSFNKRIPEITDGPISLVTGAPLAKKRMQKANYSTVKRVYKKKGTLNDIPYIGVSIVKKATEAKRYQARYTFNSTRYHLGQFPTTIEAAQAYDDFKYSKTGTTEGLNFPSRIDAKIRKSVALSS